MMRQNGEWAFCEGWTGAMGQSQGIRPARARPSSYRPSPILTRGKHKMDSSLPARKANTR